MDKENVKRKIKENVLLIVAVVFMLIPLIIAFNFLMPAHGVLLINRKPASYVLRPDFFSGLLAIAVYSAVVVRSDLSLFKNPVKIVLAILNIAFIATFSKTFLQSTEWRLFGIKTGISSQTFAVLCVIFSWVGMRTFAGFSWIILFIASISSLTLVNSEMSVRGFIYILSAFLSIGIQLAAGYISVNFDNIKNEFFASTNLIKSDVNKSLEVTKEMGAKAVNLAKSMIPVGNMINITNSATSNENKNEKGEKKQNESKN